MLTKISTSGNHGGVENVAKFFLQCQPNFLPQPSMMVQKILKFFFFKAIQIFRFSEVLWCGKFWFFSMSTIISALANYNGAENFDCFFPMLTKFSALASYGGAEYCEFFFSILLHVMGLKMVRSFKMQVLKRLQTQILWSFTRNVRYTLHEYFQEEKSMKLAIIMPQRVYYLLLWLDALLNPKR
jgi:hypothetical protein